MTPGGAHGCEGKQGWGRLVIYSALEGGVELPTRAVIGWVVEMCGGQGVREVHAPEDIARLRRS